MASNEGTTNSEESKREVATRPPRETVDGSELPFLVTHWLQNFSPGPPENTEDGEQQQEAVDAATRRGAMERIRKATSELASAFTALGAFGSSSAPFLTSNDAQQTRNSTYADVNRRWAASLRRNHLNNLVDAAISSTVAAEEIVSHTAESNLVQAAGEAIVKQRRNPSSGRTTQDAIDLDKEEGSSEAAMAQLKPSIMHRPTRVDFKMDQSQQQQQGNNLRISTNHGNLPALVSDLKQLQSKSSQTMRQYLDMKEKFESQTSELRTLKSSLKLHSTTKECLQSARLSAGASIQTAAMEISEEEQNADRVLAQLQRKIGEVEMSYAKTLEGLKAAKKDAYSQYNNTRKCLLDYSDPILEAARQRPGFGMRAAKNQGILHALANRRLGLQNHLTSKRALPKVESANVKTNHIRNAVLQSRLSHAVTINAHCHNPVYSVRFDSTGRYFITGADDNLVKVFQTRAKQAIDSIGKGTMGQGQSQTIRGAVLVCTFRGHASVINEIDVSPDNCFLATASEDGDCRVWGLKDGTPVALLRGHAGGCNAVSWSKLTPYRLLTAGHDGFARCWDIREAALKRYGSVLGKRPEYALPLTDQERASNAELRSIGEESEERAPVNLPPIPERQDEGSGTTAIPVPPGEQIALSVVAAQLPAAAASADLQRPPLPPNQASGLPDAAPLAPLPPPGATLGIEANRGNGNDAEAEAQANVANEANVAAQRQDANANNNIAQPGLFIPNDNMDEGVRLVAKFQHGTVSEEQIAGPSTRSGRGKVKVLLFARCPLGGHFATGASDGTCRIWEDINDPAVETVDRRFCTRSYDWIGGPLREKVSRRSSRTGTNRLLLELKGFMNPTTDLQYSHAGDRILVGSMLDGVLRVWTWEGDPSSMWNVKSGSNEKGLRSIVIKLTNPLKSNSGSAKTTRRRARCGTTNNASKILLDMAVWTHDDSKIITSQSQPVNGLKIEPDSNFIFLWDSRTGSCLLGIAGGHSRATPVILPHPTNSSIFCSGGSDGYVKVWDCETGKCIYSHRNEHKLRYLIDATPQEPCGLLNDGAFFPDGTGFVLSDSTGNVLIFDSIVQASEQQLSNATPSLPPAPAWMKEQYRANDYYDLKYEINGYCVEQGCNLPPHLAPRGVRCTHSGAPFSDSITEAFQDLTGPLPLSVKEAQWSRELVRSRARIRQRSSGSSKGRRGNIMQEYDPLTTVLVRGTGEVIPRTTEDGTVLPSTSVVVSTPGAQTSSAAARRDSSEQRRSNSGRLLSSNFRYLDYTDMLREEDRLGAQEDSDDEEFQPTTHRNSGRATSGTNESDDESGDEMDLDMESLESPQRRPASRSAQRQAPRSAQRSAQRASAQELEALPATRRNVELAQQAEEQRPSRSSNRRTASRNQYEEPDWEDYEEILSTNNDPSGPHVEDYNKHFFRLTGNGPPIARNWLRRLTSIEGYQGRKPYAPQVGDEVVYIPRAHFEWIQAFPSLKMPWQHWPPGAEWPVVCCRIRDVRYRFPFLDYYGNRNSNRDACNSVVAILSLEVTGIPVLDQDRNFNWPDPNFIPPARSHMFELDLFVSEYEEFLIPFDRYIWRLQCLEEAIVNNHGLTEGIEITAYYENEENESSDSDLLSFRGQLDEYAQRDHAFNDESLNNCGYGSVRIRWPESNQQDVLSPWETVVEKPISKRFALNRYSLFPDEKKRAAAALKNLKRIPTVREHLMIPVNEKRYVDYSDRVEVPMHLELVEKRLESDYYSSRLSIVADVKLIRDNCIKYNGEVGLLQDEARQMYDEFEKEMLNEEERRRYNDLKSMGALNQLSARQSRASMSLLESLPPPDTEDGATRMRSWRIRIDTRNVPTPRPQPAGTAARPLRSNFQAPEIPLFPEDATHSAAFANVLRSSSSRRESRRRSNGSDAAARLQPRQGRSRGVTSAAPALAPAPAPEPTRWSSRRRRRGTQPDASSHNVEVTTNDARTQRRRPRVAIAAQPPARQARSRRAPAAEDFAPEPTSDAKPPARRTGSRREPLVELPESESEYESDTKPCARTRSFSRRGSIEKSDSEQDGASESESEHDSSQQWARRSTRPRKPTAKQAESLSPRNIRKRNARYESDSEDISDEEEEQSGDQFESDSQPESASESQTSTPSPVPSKRPARRTSTGRNNSRPNDASVNGTVAGRRSNRGAQPSPPGQAVRRRSSRGSRVSYTENSESEFEEPQSEDISEDEEDMVSSQKQSARSRRGAAKKPASRKRPAKKQTKPKRATKLKSRPKKRQRDEYESEESDLAEVAQGTTRTSSRSRSRSKTSHPWREVPEEQITVVTLKMLEILRGMDKDGLFAIPVVEAVPDIAKDYQACITNPMDYRTIEEERVHLYLSIGQLQIDLMNVYQNCISFNGAISEYGIFAQKMLDLLDDVFERVVGGLS